MAPKDSGIDKVIKKKTEQLLGLVAIALRRQSNTV